MTRTEFRRKMKFDLKKEKLYLTRGYGLNRKERRRHERSGQLKGHKLDFHHKQYAKRRARKKWVN